MPMKTESLAAMLGVALAGALAEMKRSGVPVESPARLDAEMALAVWRGQSVDAKTATRRVAP